MYCFICKSLQGALSEADARGMLAMVEDSDGGGAEVTQARVRSSLPLARPSPCRAHW